MHTFQFSTWKLRILSVVVFALVFFISGADCKRSACWRYGHVCWGGHGKRSGQPPLTSSGSSEAGDGSDLPSPQWNSLEGDRRWKLYPEQSASLSLGKSPAKQAINYAENPYFKGAIPNALFMQKQLSKSTSLHPRMQSPIMYEQKVARMNQPLEFGSRNGLDDAQVLTDSGTSLREIFADPRIATSSVLKRNVVEDGLGNVGGTEEPLESSANGLDSGSVATFFRDRKSTGKVSVTENSEKDTRYSNENNDIKGVSQRLQPNNIYDMLSQSQYSPGRYGFPKTLVY